MLFHEKSTLTTQKTPFPTPITSKSTSVIFIFILFLHFRMRKKHYLCSRNSKNNHSSSIQNMAKQFKIEDLTKGNVWTLSESDVNQMLIEGKKAENYADHEVHYMNILRPVFDIEYFNRADEARLHEFETQQYDIFSIPNEGANNAIAIKKRQINHVTDLTLENVAHLMPQDILTLIERNMGTGWQGLPLAIQDIIESAFYIDCAVLPAYAMHRAGGIIDRRKADGYHVLEVERGQWIEGIFIKPKPRMEKLHFSSPNYNQSSNDDGEDEEDNEDEDLPEDNDDTDDANEEDPETDETNPDIEDIDIIDADDMEEEEEDNE